MIGSPGKKRLLFLFNRSKAQRRDVRTTITNGPCVPIILHASLAYTDLVVEVEGTTSYMREPSEKVS